MPMFDWRQLRRWGISEDELPPGSVVRFKELTVWERYKWRIIGVLGLCVLQSVLITVLILERRRRQRSKALLDERLRFETLLSKLSAEFASLPAGEVDLAINRWVTRLSELLEADTGGFFELARNGAPAGGNDDGEAATGKSGATGFAVRQLWPYREQLCLGETVNLSRVANVCEHAVDSEPSKKLASPKSVLGIPISVNGSTHVLAFLALRSCRAWPEDLLPRLRLVAEILPMPSLAGAASKSCSTSRHACSICRTRSGGG